MILVTVGLNPHRDQKYGPLNEEVEQYGMNTALTFYTSSKKKTKFSLKSFLVFKFSIYVQNIY